MVEKIKHIFRGGSRISSQGWRTLKKLRRTEGGAKFCGVFRVKNHDFTPKNYLFSNLAPPPLDPPLIFIVLVQICTSNKISVLTLKKQAKQQKLINTNVVGFFNFHYIKIVLYLIPHQGLWLYTISLLGTRPKCDTLLP